MEALPCKNARNRARSRGLVEMARIPQSAVGKLHLLELVAVSFLPVRQPPLSTRFPYTTLFRSGIARVRQRHFRGRHVGAEGERVAAGRAEPVRVVDDDVVAIGRAKV